MVANVSIGVLWHSVSSMITNEARSSEANKDLTKTGHYLCRKGEKTSDAGQIIGTDQHQQQHQLVQAENPPRMNGDQVTSGG